MTGPRDMQPWEIRLYTRYRANLRHAHGKPDTRKGRELHKIERAFFALPARLYVYWHHYRAQRRTRYKPETTETVETSPGVFFNAQKEDT